jgi:hypothetical protein
MDELREKVVPIARRLPLRRLLTLDFFPCCGQVKSGAATYDVYTSLIDKLRDASEHAELQSVREQAAQVFPLSPGKCKLMDVRSII